MSNLWRELNVTEPTFGEVDPDSSADQSDAIKETFERVGREVTIGDDPPITRRFSKTIYFPAGTYLFSEQLLDLVVDDSDPVVPNITIRGDGPGRTILKLMSNNRFNLDNFDDSAGWFFDSGTKELYAPAPSSSSTVNSLTYAPTIPGDATGLYVSVKMPAANIQPGTKFEVFVDGTQVGTSYASYGDTYMLLEYSLPPLVPPATEWDIQLRLVYVHDSSTTGNVVVISEMGWTKDTTIFSLKGSGSYPSTLKTLQNFTIKDLTLDGSATFHSDGNPRTIVKAKWFDLDRVSLIRMENVLMTSTYGTAIHAKCWWDSVMSDVQFARCGAFTGDVETSSPVVVMEVQDDTDVPSKRFTACNNIKWDACRWEASDFTSCQWNDYTRQIYFLGCKWHGKLITGATGTSVVEFPQVDIKPDCSSISFTGCNLTNWSDTHIEATGAFGITVTACSISGAGVENTSTNRIKCGVLLRNCSGSSISGNVFGLAGVDGANRDGGFRILGTNKGRNFAANNGGAPDQNFEESFALQGSTSGQIGELGWDTVSTPDISVTLRSQGRIGIVHVKASEDDVTKGIRLDSGFTVGVGSSYLSQGQILIRFTARLLGSTDPVTSTAGFNLGLMDSSSTDFDPIGIYFRKVKGNVDLYGVCKNSGGDATISMGMKQDELDAWHDFQIRMIPYKDPQYSPTLPTIGFQVDSRPELFVTTRIPSGISLLPFFVVQPQEAQEKSIEVDTFNVEFVGGDAH